MSKFDQIRKVRHRIKFSISIVNELNLPGCGKLLSKLKAALKETELFRQTLDNRRNPSKKIKFRCIESGKKWSGTGRKPKWVSFAESNGTLENVGKIDECLDSDIYPSMIINDGSTIML